MEHQFADAIERRHHHGGHAVASVIVVAALLGTAAPARADDATSLEGAWACEEDGARSTLEFVSSTELSYDGVRSTYQVVGDTIVVEEADGAVPYFYGFDGDALVIISPDGWVTWCSRSAPPEPSTAPAGQGSVTGGTTAGMLVPGPDWPAYVAPAEPVSEGAPSAQALLYKFAGRWDHVTANTVTNLYLHPDGTYESSYEAGYGGQFEDQGGYQTGSWGTTGTEEDRGQWMLEGSLRQGTLTLIDPTGAHSEYRYQVHIDDGEVYWGEYLFDGELYQVEYIYR